MVVRSPFPEVVIPDEALTPYVLRHAERLASKPALVFGPDPGSKQAWNFTYGELATAVQRLAGALRAGGSGRGDVLAIYSPNLAEFVVPFLAAGLLGGATTTINPLYTTGELSAQLRDSGATILFTVGALLDRAREAKAQSNVRQIVLFGIPDMRDGSAFTHLGAGETTFAALLQEGAREDVPVVTQEPVDPAQSVVALPYSSGTTGLAKGVMLTHRNLVANLAQMAPMGVVSESDVVLGVLPFYHIYGITVILALGLASGATIVVVPRFELEHCLDLIQRERVSVAFVVPPIALALAKSPLVERFDLSSLRVLMSAAAPLGREIQEACVARLGCPFIQAWGMTETSPDVTLEPLDPARCVPGAVGLVIPNSECKVVDVETGAEVGPGVPGEVCARGPQNMKGYLHQPEATAQILDAGGWLHTGDIGYFDEGGHLYVVDRLKELIKYKGYQVAPAELEAILVAHPAIAEAAVIPVANAEAGEVPKACIVLKPGASATADEVMAYVAERVAPYKRVRLVEFIDAVPKSASGKILRRVLIERERGQQQGG